MPPALVVVASDVEEVLEGMKDRHLDRCHPDVERQQVGRGWRDASGALRLRRSGDLV